MTNQKTDRDYLRDHRVAIALLVIRTLLHSTISRPIWRILTALRGPDSDDYFLKYTTTSRVRRILLGVRGKFGGHDVGENPNQLVFKGAFVSSEPPLKAKQELEKHSYGFSRSRDHFLTHITAATSSFPTETALDKYLYGDTPIPKVDLLIELVMLLDEHNPVTIANEDSWVDALKKAHSYFLGHPLSDKEAREVIERGETSRRWLTGEHFHTGE